MGIWSQRHHNGNSGFSLVELSIVLVILGLLAGGILAGQNLIRAAELRSVVTDINTYTAAIHTFRDQYLGIPGDLRKAEDFWGTHTSCPGDNTTPMTSSATCNGNGNGSFDFILASTANERFTFWQHLANAGLIPGQYTGVSAGAGGGYEEVGTNTPQSKLGSNIGYRLTWDSFWAAAIYGRPLPYKNYITIAANNGSGTIRNPELTPTELYSIDKKADDGKLQSGRILHFEPSASLPDCVTTSDFATAEYKVSFDDVACVPLIGGLF